MPLSFMRDTVTVLRAPLKDVRGTKVRDWTERPASTTTTTTTTPAEPTVTRITLTGVQVTAASTSQDRAGREVQVTDRRTLRASFDADVQPGDRVVWNGVTYEVDGEVFKTESPTGRVSSTRCALARWEG